MSANRVSIIVFVLAAFALFGQRISRMTLPWVIGTTPPGTCFVGQPYFDTDATGGQNLLICTATNTWTSLVGLSSTTGPGQIELKEDPLNGTSKVAIVAPSSLAGNVTFPLPALDPTSGNWLKSAGPSSPATWNNLYYQAQAGCSVTAGFADSTVYYFGGAPGTTCTLTTAATKRLYFTAPGTITHVYGYAVMGTPAGSAENSTLDILLNNSGVTNVTSSLALNAAFVTFNNTGLSIAVVAGDYIEFRLTNPNWVSATTPANIALAASIGVKQ